jgi:hypothetical protein
LQQQFAVLEEKKQKLLKELEEEENEKRQTGITRP